MLGAGRPTPPLNSDGRLYVSSLPGQIRRLGPVCRGVVLHRAGGLDETPEGAAHSSESGDVYDPGWLRYRVVVCLEPADLWRSPLFSKGRVFVPGAALFISDARQLLHLPY